MAPGSKRIIGITGTPGTGKKSVAPFLARSLGVPCVGLNDLARTAGLVRRGQEVDAALLKRQVSARVTGPAVVYGHLLPHSVVKSSVDWVGVLRCEPAVLKARLESRGYAEAKALENVRAELIGLVSDEAFRAFGREKTVEVDTTATSPEEAAEALLLSAKRRGADRSRIDWMRGYDSAAKLRSLLPSER
ncbi:MAG: adenylate kinase family protein [Nitrososphaerota archaeon]|nr:adenylate kinase family protein [Nitrososphaerota archaeon]